MANETGINNMKIEVYEPTDRDEWLKLRLQDVTASEVASLYNTGYMSLYELWHTKKRGEVANFDSERMRWGRRLERAIAEGICEDLGLEIQTRPVQYFRSPEHRMGATPDFFVNCPKRGQGLIQIKNVDSMIFAQKWSRPDDSGEAPDFIEMQVQQELMMTGCSWGLIGVLVGGNKSYVYERKYYPEVGLSLQTKVREFWESIEANVDPKPDFSRDADFIASLYNSVTEGKVVDMSGNEKVESLIRLYDENATLEKAAGMMKDSLKAELLTIIGDAEVISTTTGKISAKTVKETPPTVITTDMVGQTYGGRKGYRGFRLTLNKE
jgi:predicted phage-related endonuclease